MTAVRSGSERRPSGCQAPTVQERDAVLTGHIGVPHTIELRLWQRRESAVYSVADLAAMSSACDRSRTGWLESDPLRAAYWLQIVPR